MKIDSKKLAKIITTALKDIKEPGCVASGVVIGEFEGAQIQLTVTRDADDFGIKSKAHICAHP